MKRRFLQFGLRGLLGLTALVCLLFGTGHLLETYRNWLDVDGNTGVGWSIRTARANVWANVP